MSAEPIPNTFRVVRVERASCLVLTAEGTVSIPTTEPVTVGDVIQLNDQSQMIGVLPRRTEIRRLSTSGQAVEQVLAANVDVVAVCAPLELGARVGRIERFLAIAWASGAMPVLVATKADLCPPAQFEAAIGQLMGIAPGVEVLAVSVDQPHTLDSLRAMVSEDRTLAVLGASGVGKSSLINALLGEQRLATQEIRDDGKGRHTTAWRELVEVPGGGYLIDTPGLRAVSMADAQDGVDLVFAEVLEYAQGCRFSDCAHNGEPGCAVAEAIESGDLAPDRFERHQRLQRELDYQARRFDQRAQSEERNKWKQIHKAMRARGNPKL